MHVSVAVPPPKGSTWTETAVASLVGQQPKVCGSPGEVVAARLLADGRVEITLDAPGLLADLVYPDGHHAYWSTHCRHERHGTCSATELAPGVPRRPAQCKTCSAPCTCRCHGEAWPIAGTPTDSLASRPPAGPFGAGSLSNALA